MHKDYASVVPGIMTAAGTLLRCRNQHMNAHATLTGLQLKRGGATKMTHQRLHDRALTVSYTTTLEKQKMLGVGFDGKVKEWKKIMEEEADEINELMQQIAPLQEKVDSANHNFADLLQLRRLKDLLKDRIQQQFPGYQLVGDNIDFCIDPRQFTRDSGRKSLHYFNFLAVKHRVSITACL